MNILIKLTCLIGLVIAPILGGHTLDATSEEHNTTVEVSVNATSDDSENLTATIEVVTNKDGVKTSVSKTVEGTQTEVDKAVDEIVEKAKDN